MKKRAEPKRGRGRPALGRLKLQTYVAGECLECLRDEAEANGEPISDLLTRILERRYRRKS